MERTPAAPFISRFPTIPRLFLGGRPAAFGAVVAAERAFHLGAGDAADEVATHALVVHVGEADPESAHPRLAQPRQDRAEVGRALDFLEPLVEVQAHLLRAATG